MSDVSRRGFFRFGLGEALRDLRQEPADEEHAAPEPEPDPADDEHGELRARLRDAWEACDATTLYAEAGEALVEAATVVPAEVVLDVGCGAGTVALEVAGRRAVVTACDDAPGRLAGARRRADEDPELDLEITWVRADAAALPFGDARFATTLSAFAPMFCLDPGAALAEMVRVTRSEGLVGVALWTADGVVGELLALAAERDPRPPGLDEPLAWASEECLRAALEPGLEAIEVERRELALTFSDRGEAADRLLRSLGPLAAAHARTPLGGEVRAIVDRLAGPGDGAAVLTASYLLLTGDRP